LTVSIIIPTYNGAHKITAMMRSLASQTIKDFELIIVIDGSTDNTLEVIKKGNWDFGNLQIIQQSNKGRAGARNAGAERASGDLLLFFDDDMRPCSHAIQSHIDHHRSIPDSVLIGAQIDDPTLTTEMQLYKQSRSNQWAKKLHQYPSELTFDYLTAAHFSISKKLFAQIGGFDESLTDAEDRELSIRLTKAGISRYYKSIEAIHHDPITAFYYIKRLRQYQIANGRVDAMHQLESSFSRAGRLKKCIYWLTARRWYIRCMDGYNWLKIFPEKLRYKLYDVIFTGLSVYFPNREL